jgi:hypothetical protein
MITIDRMKYQGTTWKRRVSDALKEGDNVTLKNFRIVSDLNNCEEIGKKHRAKVSLHLDHTVCCFHLSSKKKRQPVRTM